MCTTQKDQRMIVVFVVIAGVLCRFVTPQLAASYLFCLLNLMVMAVSTAIAYFRRPLHTVLPDVGHDLLPHIATIAGTDSHLICDRLLQLTVACTLTFIFRNTTQQRVHILQRFFLSYGSIMALRTITLLMTSLPDPYPLCRHSAPEAQRHWHDMPWSLIVSNAVAIANRDSSLTCGDLIFSGHTSLFVLCALTLHTYYQGSVNHGVNPLKLLVWLLSVAGTVLLLISRMHYTIDIGISYFVTVTVWNFYHGLVRAIHEKHYIQPLMWLDGKLLHPFVAWLETGISFHTFSIQNKKRKTKINY